MDATAVATPAAPQAGEYNATSPDEKDTAKRKRQPRNSACQPCASLKMKCVPSSESGKCERCHRMGRECVQAVPKPRKRRTESGVGLELANDLPPSISLSGETEPVLVPKGAPKAAPKKQYGFESGTAINSMLSRADIRHTGSKSFTTLLAQGLKLDSAHINHEDLLRGIDYSLVQSSFTIFRQFSAYFPFVNINPGEDAVSMAAHRPFTIIAVCTVTAGANTGMQERLRQAVRLALSAKAIVEGECSIDLLLGLLVFIAWHHHYMVKHQIYQYLHLLAGMAADLGFYETVLHINAEAITRETERDRAFLGCYYICACLSTKGFGKPNPLFWTDSLRQRAENSAGELIPVLELARALEELDDAMQTQSNLKQPAYALFVEMHAKAANHRLKSLKREHPSLGTNIAFAAAMIDVHRKLLAANLGPNTSTLIQCACSIREYVDEVLGRPPIMMHQMVIVDWCNLLTVLVLMAKVSTSLPTTGGWETGALDSMLPPEKILDTISAHMANAPHGDPLAPRNEVLVRWFQTFCSGINSHIVHGKSIPATDMPLPYAEGIQPGLVGPLPEGILDDSFLSNIMRPP